MSKDLAKKQMLFFFLFFSIGKMKADKAAKSLPTYQRKTFCFSSFYEAKHFFSKKKHAQNQRAKFIFSKWAKILLYSFGLFQQVFENLKLNKLTKEERRLHFEDRIWRLKFGKSAVLKLSFEEWILKLSFNFLWGLVEALKSGKLHFWK